jgi:hypothetical protein
MMEIGDLVVGAQAESAMYHDIAGLVGIILSGPNFYGQYCVYIAGRVRWLLKEYLKKLK